MALCRSIVLAAGIAATASTGFGAVELLDGSSLNASSFGSARRLADPQDDLEFIGQGASLPLVNGNLIGGTAGQFSGPGAGTAGSTSLEGQVTKGSGGLTFSVMGAADYATDDYLGAIGSTFTIHAVFDLANADPGDQSLIEVNLELTGDFLDMEVFGLFDPGSNRLEPGSLLLAPGEYRIEISASLLAGVTARSVDSFNGTGSFSIVPSPSALGLMALAMIGSARRRR